MKQDTPIMVVTGFHTRKLSPSWGASFQKPQSLPTEALVPEMAFLSELKRLEMEIQNSIETLWKQARLSDQDQAFAGATFGTLYGSNIVQEYIYGTLQSGGKWLNPEAFLYYSPHAIAGNIVKTLQLKGDAITFVGPYADSDALGHSLRLLALGRQEIQLCCEFHISSAFEEEILTGAKKNHKINATQSVILETKESALKRNVTFLAEIKDMKESNDAPDAPSLSSLASFLENDFAGQRPKFEKRFGRFLLTSPRSL